MTVLGDTLTCHDGLVFHHVTMRVSDRDASERFLRTVLAPLGLRPTGDDGEFLQIADLSVAPARADRPRTTGLHVGLAAGSVEAVDAFWRAGVDAGYRSDGEPGPRPEYSPGYYGAFLLDPDGNSIEAARHEGLRRPPGNIDHLWMRVGDARTSEAFYSAIAPVCGLTLRASAPGLVRFRGPHGGSVTFIEGEPRTTGVHFALPVADRLTVDAFHAAALAAGGEDHGAPGLRPEYSPGYYGAFVLDPDRLNLEAVVASGAPRG